MTIAILSFGCLGCVPKAKANNTPPSALTTVEVKAVNVPEQRLLDLEIINSKQQEEITSLRKLIEAQNTSITSLKSRLEILEVQSGQTKSTPK